ncbi:hypothetical protein KEHDKFFH_14045 [Marinobacter maroccanus]|uniref:GGDEF-domain containing protein n=1 Tax=Marinobacter maroccanus TaxID=2055143 RepID=A0A2S5Z7X8_9GAMM|nr:bifunctional diguanylate cyclase/phosphodiesterase [Marinobacter maroccanus]PPI83486.1 hypothetical protein KEHDKFFH_14045 [Marinobacter maroccanus]
MDDSVENQVNDGRAPAFLVEQLLRFHREAETITSVEALQSLFMRHLLTGLELVVSGLQATIRQKPDFASVPYGSPLALRVDEVPDEDTSLHIQISVEESSVPCLSLMLANVSGWPEQLQSYVELLMKQFSVLLEGHARRDQLDHLEMADPLTLVNNRRSFQKELRKRCESLTSFTLFIVNLDRFSRINDVLGPEAGDDVLVRVANRLSELIDSMDHIARINGDEFVLIREGADEQLARVLADQIHSALAQRLTIAGRPIRCSASIGITLCPGTSLRPAELLRGARVAMADAKRNQQGTCLYSGQVDMDFSEQLLIESHLERAIEQDGFELAAQPIFNVYSGEITELEILLRWTLPGHGPVSPETFVSVAENIGLSERLDRYVMSKALAAARGVRLPISVNLAAPTLYSETFVPFVEALLETHDRLPGQLGIEITERIIARPDEARASVDALGRMGVHIAIDDFGVGYSSLGVLPELPISRLKIDKKFLLGKDQNPRYEEIIIGILRMASALGLESLVEGVEDAELLGWLSQVGCDFAQGFGLGRPIPLDKALESLRETNGGQFASQF